MDKYKIWTCKCVSVLFICGLIPFANAEGDVAKMEKSIYEYYRYVSRYVWIWKVPHLTCGRLGIVSDRSEVNTETKEITLESQGCVRIQMQVLACVYKNVLRKPKLEMEMIAATLFNVRGVHGEVYAVEPPKGLTQCHDPDTPVIVKCIHDADEDLRKDFSEIENLFCNNHKTVSSQPWEENLQYVCTLACPEQLPVGTTTVSRRPVVLESSTECGQIEMNILECECVREELESKIVYCAKGLGGEVYKMSESKKGDDPETFYIRRRIIDFDGKRAVPLCPRTQNVETVTISVST